MASQEHYRVVVTNSDGVELHAYPYSHINDCQHRLKVLTAETLQLNYKEWSQLQAFSYVDGKNKQPVMQNLWVKRGVAPDTITTSNPFVAASFSSHGVVTEMCIFPTQMLGECEFAWLFEKTHREWGGVSHTPNPKAIFYHQSSGTSQQPERTPCAILIQCKLADIRMALYIGICRCFAFVQTSKLSDSEMESDVARIKRGDNPICSESSCERYLPLEINEEKAEESMADEEEEDTKQQQQEEKKDKDEKATIPVLPMDFALRSFLVPADDRMGILIMRELLTTLYFRNQTHRNANTQPVIPSKSPGPQPHALRAKDLAMLRESKELWRVTEKTDGHRVLIAIGAKGSVGGTFIIDRECRIWQVRPELDAFSRLLQMDESSKGKLTFMDGEATYAEITRRTDTGDVMTFGPHVMIFDCIQVNDVDVTALPLGKRMAEAEKVVWGPLRKSYKGIPQPFGFQLKRQRPVSSLCGIIEGMGFSSTGCGRVYKDIRPKSTIITRNDGLCFQRDDAPYLCGPDDLKKWKWPEMLTYDLLALGYKHTTVPTTLTLFSMGKNTLCERVKVDTRSPGMKKILPEMNSIADAARGKPVNIIIECRKSRTTGEYDAVKLRTDKTEPNFEGVVVDTMGAFEDNITLEKLASALKQ